MNHISESMDEDLHPESAMGSVKVDVIKEPPRLRLNRMYKYASIYQKLLMLRDDEYVRISGITNGQARSILASLQRRTLAIHGKKLSLRKEKDPNTYLLAWRRK
jgi:hypothetical protein